MGSEGFFQGIGKFFTSRRGGLPIQAFRTSGELKNSVPY